MSDTINMTKADLDAFVKEALGPVIAEQRAFHEEMGRRAAEQPALPSWMTGTSSRATGKSDLPAGALFARTVGSLVAGKISGLGVKGALSYAEKAWGTGAEMEPVMKALQAGDFTGGGVLIGPSISNDIIEILRPAVVCRSMGARIEPMPNGTASIPKQNATSTSAYRGENVATNASTPPEFGYIHLSSKELITKLPISNKLIRYALGDVEARVITDAREQMARREDIAFIRCDGTGNTPRGLRYWANAANVGAATNSATPTHQNIASDLGKAEFWMQVADVQMVRPGWIFAPRTTNYMKYLLTTDGQYAFQAEMSGGTLFGKPFKTTTQIPTNLGGGTDESEIYLVDFDAVIIADTLKAQVDVTTEGSYTNSSGTMLSAFDRDETVVRIITEHDLGVRHDKAISVLTGVKWKAA